MQVFKILSSWDGLAFLYSMDSYSHFISFLLIISNFYSNKLTTSSESCYSKFIIMHRLRISLKALIPPISYLSKTSISFSKCFTESTVTRISTGEWRNSNYSISNVNPLKKSSFVLYYYFFICIYRKCLGQFVYTSTIIQFSFAYTYTKILQQFHGIQSIQN